MKNIKKILLIMAITMALGTSAFAASGFEFILNVPFGLSVGFQNVDVGVTIPNSSGVSQSVVAEAKAGIGFDIGVAAQLGYMFQVKNNFAISLLGELGYSHDTIAATYGKPNVDTYSAFDFDGLKATYTLEQFQIGLLPKFNIGAFAIGIGGGVKIPAVATLRYGYGVWNADLNREEGIDTVTLKRQDIVDLFSPALIGYMKFTFDYYLFFTDKIGMNFGFYLGGSFGPKVRDLKLGGNAFDFGLQLGFRFGPKA